MNLISFTGLLTSTVFLAACVCLLSYLPFGWWMSDLFQHFRLQYALFFGAAALLLLFSRKWIWAGACLLLATSNTAELAPRWFASPPSIEEQGQSLRLITFNVNSRGDPEQALKVIDQAQPDLLLLLEVTQEWQAHLELIRQQLPHHIVHSRKDNFGIALFSRFPLEGQVEWIGPALLPSIHANVDFDGKTLEFWGTHPPPPVSPAMRDWQDGQLKALAIRMKTASHGVLMGDFNTTPYARNFKALLQTTGLRDASFGFGIQGTWPLSVNILSIPIDHVLHTKDIVTTNAQVFWETGSDHGALAIDVILSTASSAG